MIVGGASRIGLALGRDMAGRCRPVVRRPSGLAHEVVVDDYAAIPPACFGGIARVVNCAGVTDGDDAALHRANVAMPLAVAERARAQGVRQFVHVSSFSVYGRAEAISHATAEDPVAPYGISKALGDRGLLALSRHDFAVTILRLPLIYARDAMGKLGALLTFWQRVRMLPVPAQDITRAMIGTELAADVLAAIVRAEPATGIVHAADPEHFSYAAAAQAGARRLYRLPLPQRVTVAVRALSSGLGDRLFADSVLAPGDNLALSFGCRSRLHADLAAALAH